MPALQRSDHIRLTTNLTPHEVGFLFLWVLIELRSRWQVLEHVVN